MSLSVTPDQILAEVRQLWGVFFTRPSTGVFLSLDPLESLCLTLYWSLLVWVDLSLSYLQLTVSQSVSQSDHSSCVGGQRQKLLRM